jgi:hypothetical protein
VVTVDFDRWVLVSRVDGLLAAGYDDRQLGWGDVFMFASSADALEFGVADADEPAEWVPMLLRDWALGRLNRLGDSW